MYLFASEVFVTYQSGRVKEKNPWVRFKIWLVSLLAYWLVYALHKTLTYEFYGQENIPRGSAVIAVWHQNTLLSVTSLVPLQFHLLVSASLDGELISSVAYRLGLSSFRGSSSKGGARALLESTRFVRHGGRLAIAVDGPKGPAREPKEGVVFLGKKTGAPVVPMASVASRYWVLRKTWDGFRVPKPFSTVTVRYGAPLSDDLSTSTLRSSLNDLESLTRLKGSP